MKKYILALLVAVNAYSGMSVAAVSCAPEYTPISCDSNGGGQNACPVPDVLGPSRLTHAYVLAQASKATCTYGSSWNYSDRDLLVSGGCRATFCAKVSFEQPLEMPCDSNNKATVVCPLPPGSLGAVLVRRNSSTACTQGSSYIIGNNYIQVSAGCRADFRILN